MKIYKINDNVKKILLDIGTTKEGIKILTNKSNVNQIYIKDLKTGAGNILKQDALSVGADVGVSRECVVCGTEYTDALLLGTMSQLQKLAKKLKAQPFGLKDLGLYLDKLTKTKAYKTKIMGIINANDDSFFDGSRFVGSDAITKIKNMINDGANIIDIGAVSSAPNTKNVSPIIELERIKPIIDILYQQKLYNQVKFSIDSYTPEVVEYALDHGVSMLNDITALESDELAQISAKYRASVILMHMQNRPHNMQDNPSYDNVVVEVSEFLSTRIEKAKDFGINDIIIDIGIGFGKTLEHNIDLIKSIGHFASLGHEVLVGASRKRMIDEISSSNIDDRLAGTLAIHMRAVENGASIVRVHDVAEHVQAFKVLQSLK